MNEYKKKMLTEEIQSNEELIDQFRKEIHMLQSGTSIGAQVPLSQRPTTIALLERSIRDREEANRLLEKELQELE